MGIGPAVYTEKAAFLLAAENEPTAWPANARWSNDPETARGTNSFYYPRLNQVYVRGEVDTEDMIRLDPLCLITSEPTTRYFDDTTPATLGSSIVGEWDPATNTQTWYGTNSSLEIVPGDFTNMIPGTDPQDWLDLGFHAAAGEFADNEPILGAIDGRRTLNSGSMIIFESWGYTVQVDANVWLDGGQEYRHLLTKTSLSTGLTSRMTGSDEVNPTDTGFYTGYFSNTGGVYTYTKGLKNGFSFQFQTIQFVPDIDDTNYLAANPKGRLVFTIRTNSGGGTGADSTAMLIGTDCQVYVKITDFNPNNVSAPPGGINRVHGRERLFSRFQLRQDDNSTNSDARTWSLGKNPSRWHRTGASGNGPFYHPQSDSFLNYFRTVDGVPDGFSGLYFRNFVTPAAVAVDELTAPSPLGLVTTNKTVRFRATCHGDLGEPCAGINVAFTLRRLSSVNEALDTALLGPTSTVDNIPIDAGTLVVKYLGTTLTLTTDYTVVESTGVITWAGGHAPPLAVTGYTATYEHATNPVEPGHGSLLTSMATTDQFGVVEARVTYAEDATLVGQRDQMESLEI